MKTALFIIAGILIVIEWHVLIFYVKSVIKDNLK